MIRAGLVAAALVVSTTASPALEGRLSYDSIHVKALEGNLLGDSSDRKYIVYLPPSYDAAPARRYPVVYLLQGYGGDAKSSWIDGAPPIGYQGLNMKTAMDEAIAGGLREFIVVMPDGNNKYGGSHYVNSSVSGNWADYIAKELVAAVDGKYRTIPSPASRGLAGHSMGGRGTFYLAAKYPGVYGSIYAMSAGNMAYASFPVLPVVYARFIPNIPDPANPPTAYFKAMSLAVALSPNPARPLLADIPYAVKDEQVVPVDAVLQRWIAEDPITVVAQNVDNLRALRAIYFSCGTEDQLIGANRLMRDVLTKVGLKFTYEEYPGTHNGQIRERIEQRVLPMFSQVLEFK